MSNPRRNALGRGLSALLENAATDFNTTESKPVNSINENFSNNSININHDSMIKHDSFISNENRKKSIYLKKENEVNTILSKAGKSVIEK